MLQKSGKRIAKNTLFLYCRMFLTMAVSLYTSRVVLNALGVADYGVYNVVGGVVAMLGFFSSSIGTSTQRFLNVGMADDSQGTLTQIFSTAVNVHAIIGIVTVLLLETVGLWFVLNKLVIPPGQETAAFWVYQCSIATFFVTIISVPYNSALVAYEKMSAFAMMSIIEVAIKLGIAIGIAYYPGNRLIMFAILNLASSVLMRVLYGSYCSRVLKEIRYRFYLKKELIKKMVSFSGWMIFGCLTDILSTQGVNMLINLFFGPIYNAARAIAVSVQTAVGQFANNFIMSVNPQIVQSYAAKDYGYAYRLVFSASKLSFFLMFMLIVPIMLRSQQILEIWLKIVPADTSIFVNLILIEYLIRASYTPIAQISQASGNIRLYQLVISGLFLSTFILTLVLFKLGFPVYSTFVLSAAISFVGLGVRVLILRSQQHFPARRYLVKVTLPLAIVALVSGLVNYGFNRVIMDNFLGLVIMVVSSVVINVMVIWSIGLNREERSLVTSKVKQGIGKRFARA